MSHPRSARSAEPRPRGRARSAARMLGPAFVASVAYVDPGNFATNFAGGAQYGSQLAWVIVMADLMAMLVQYLTSKAGLSTGRSLPELCRARFGRGTNTVLWIQAEIIAMATDLAEFTGAAVGLNLAFRVPLLPAGLITAAVAFMVLALEQRGYRRFELAVIALLAIIGLGFLYMCWIARDYGGPALAAGLVPSLEGGGTLKLAVAIVGATVMPHVVYLHSALPGVRAKTVTPQERRMLLRWNRRDCIAGLGLAGLVNLAMLYVAASLLHHHGLADTAGLAAVHSRLESAAGGGAALVFAITLMASGLSSSSVGTYAGQVVMAGFTDWRIPLVGRRALTMLPSLAVLAAGANVSQVLVYSQIVLSFGIPFALVPLVLVTRDRRTMIDMVNRRLTTAAAVAVTVIVISLNVCLIA